MAATVGQGRRRRRNSASKRSHRPSLPRHQPLRPRNVAARFRVQRPALVQLSPGGRARLAGPQGREGDAGLFLQADRDRGQNERWRTGDAAHPDPAYIFGLSRFPDRRNPDACACGGDEGCGRADRGCRDHRSSQRRPCPYRRRPGVLQPVFRLHPATSGRSFSQPGTARSNAIALALSIGVGVPQRRVEVTDLLGVIEAVAAFGRDVQAANPAASFEVSTRVVAGRKPRGFDAADKADAFGGRAFLRSDVDQSALHRRLVDPAAAVDGARAPESAQ